MQSGEYNKLFEDYQGKPMIARLSDMKEDEARSLKELAEGKAREIIAKYEKSMPDEMHIKIKQYIHRRKKAGCTEKAIRKAVKKKFNITVV